MEDEVEKNANFTAEAFPAEGLGLVFTQVTAVLEKCCVYLKEDHVTWEFSFPFAENSVSLGVVGLLDLRKKNVLDVMVKYIDALVYFEEG